MLDRASIAQISGCSKADLPLDLLQGIHDSTAQTPFGTIKPPHASTQKKQVYMLSKWTVLIMTPDPHNWAVPKRPYAYLYSKLQLP